MELSAIQNNSIGATSRVHSTSAGQQLLDLRVHWLHEYRGSTGLWAITNEKENEHMYTSLWVHDVHMECLHDHVIWYMFLYEKLTFYVVCYVLDFLTELWAHPPQCCYQFWDTGYKESHTEGSADTASSLILSAVHLIWIKYRGWSISGE